MNRLLVILFFIVLLPTLCNGQKKYIKVEGRVISEELEPLKNVIVRTSNKKYHTLTDSSGHFQISIPRKHTKLIVQHLGYEIDTVEVSTTKSVNSILFLQFFDGIEGYIHSTKEIEQYNLNKRKRKQQLFEEAVRRKIF